MMVVVILQTDVMGKNNYVYWEAISPEKNSDIP
jgi:hypothetical protein